MSGRVVAKPKPAFSWDQIDGLRASAGLALDDVPADAVSARDWGERYGISLHSALDELRRLVRAGVMACGWTRRGHRKMQVYWPA